jgi:hypothetical protein
MRLPQAARADLLEFLGATPVGDRQIDSLIVEARQMHKRAQSKAAQEGRLPEGA